jgi:hypothetical protein
VLIIVRNAQLQTREPGVRGRACERPSKRPHNRQAGTVRGPEHQLMSGSRAAAIVTVCGPLFVRSLSKMDLEENWPQRKVTKQNLDITHPQCLSLLLFFAAPHTHQKLLLGFPAAGTIVIEIKTLHLQP